MSFVQPPQTHTNILSFLDDASSSSDDFQSSLSENEDDSDHSIMQQSSLMQEDSEFSMAGANQNKVNHASNQDGEKLIRASKPPRRRIKQEMVEDDDLTIALRAIMRGVGKKTSLIAAKRQDVCIKTIFRMLRFFYKCKLDTIIGKRSKSKPKTDILLCIDRLTENLFVRFEADQSIEPEVLANYLGALIYPKSIQIFKLPGLREMADKNSRNEWESEKKLRDKRILNIKMIAESTRNVLYGYNKNHLKAFYELPENVHILHYFLIHAKQVFQEGGLLEQQPGIDEMSDSDSSCESGQPQDEDPSQEESKENWQKSSEDDLAANEVICADAISDHVTLQSSKDSQPPSTVIGKGLQDVRQQSISKSRLHKEIIKDFRQEINELLQEANSRKRAPRKQPAQTLSDRKLINNAKRMRTE